MKSELLKELDNLSPAEKIQLVQDLWDSVPADKIELTEEQKKELDQRIADYKNNPDSSESWEKVKSDILKKL